MMVPEAVSEIRTLLVVAKTYMATQQPAKAVKALNEALALLPPLEYDGVAVRFTAANTP
jgi:hypothetical protein